jgi:predicted O-methyltransferase YrrM
MNATRDQIEAYLDALAQRQHPDELLDAMESYASEHNMPVPGRAAGAFLQLAAQSIGAKRVLELGSGIGYGSLWLARAVGVGGEVTSIEPNAERAEVAHRFLEDWSVTVKIRVGDVVEAAGNEAGPFDIIYCDARKDMYPAAWLAASPKIRVGGLWLSDNALWHGGAVTGDDVNEETAGFAAAIQRHNDLVASDPGFISSLVPIRDGVLAALRVEPAPDPPAALRQAV